MGLPEFIPSYVFEILIKSRYPRVLVQQNSPRSGRNHTCCGAPIAGYQHPNTRWHPLGYPEQAIAHRSQTRNNSHSKCRPKLFKILEERY